MEAEQVQETLSQQWNQRWLRWSITEGLEEDHAFKWPRNTGEKVELHILDKNNSAGVVIVKWVTMIGAVHVDYNVSISIPDISDLKYISRISVDTEENPD